MYNSCKPHNKFTIAILFAILSTFILIKVSVANTIMDTLSGLEYSPDHPYASNPSPNITNDLNTALMHCTYRIVGTAKHLPDETTESVGGTCFVLSQPCETGDIRGAKTKLILVTAKHLFDGTDGSYISDDVARLLFRIRSGDGWQLVEVPFHIRDHGKPLWVQHPTADVAAIDLLANVEPRHLQLIKENVGIISTQELADDATLTNMELHPGDELLCLSYTADINGTDEFPILRAGKIASYPLLPTKKYNRILFNLETFQSNIGGPVYMAESSRVTNKGHHGSDYALLGLVTQPSSSDKIPKLGIVVPATFISETIAKLSTNETY